MAKKRKGELPSGNIRKQVYAGTEIVRDANGVVVIDPKTGKPKKKRKYISVTSSSAKEVERMKSQVKVDLAENKNRTVRNITLYDAIDEYINSREQLSKSPTTMQDYKVIQKNAFKDIMFLSLQDLDEEILQDAVNIESKRTNRKRTVNPGKSRNLDLPGFSFVYYAPRFRSKYSSNFSFILSGISFATGHFFAFTIAFTKAYMKSISICSCSTFMTFLVS